MKPTSRGPADGKQPAPTAGTGGQSPQGPRRRDLRIDATPEQLAAVIGAGPPKTAHEWNFLKRKPAQLDSERGTAPGSSKPSAAKAGQEDV